MRFYARAALCALSLTLAPPVAAGGFELFGVTPRDIGMASAMTAAAVGYSALYYNPAALVMDGQDSLAGSFQLSVPALWVDREREDPDSPRTYLPDTHAGITVGWVKPFGGVLKKRLAVGLALSMPAQRLLRVQGLDPIAPQYYLYQSLQDKLLIHLGVSGLVTDWLSLGVGLQVLADLDGAAEMDLDLLSGTFTRRAVGVTLQPTLSMYAGALTQFPAFGGTIRAGLAYRGQNSLSFSLPVYVHAGESLDLRVDVEQTVLFTPHQLALGFAFTDAEQRFTLALDLTYALWGNAPDPSPRLSGDIEGKLLEAFGLEGALDFGVGVRDLELGFEHTFNVRAGAEYQALDWLTVRGGYGFRPTPSPLQTGSTSYLDNDAHILGLGLGVAFLNPLKDRPAEVQLDLSFQATFLRSREVTRRFAEHRVGNLSHGGAMYHFSLGAIHRF